jgi:hypothetical protein
MHLHLFRIISPPVIAPPMFSRFFATSSSSPRRLAPQRSNTAPAAAPSPRNSPRPTSTVSSAGTPAKPVVVADSVVPAYQDLSRSPENVSALLPIVTAPPVGAVSPGVPLAQENQISSTAHAEDPVSQSPVANSDGEPGVLAPILSARVDGSGFEVADVLPVQATLVGETNTDILAQDTAEGEMTEELLPQETISTIPEAVVLQPNIASEPSVSAADEPGIELSTASHPIDLQPDVSITQEVQDISSTSPPHAAQPSLDSPIPPAASLILPVLSAVTLPPSGLAPSGATTFPIDVEVVAEPIDTMAEAAVRPMTAEDELLALDEVTGNNAQAADHSIRTAPIFTRDALDVVGEGVLPQRALYARVLGQHSPGFPTNLMDPKLYINTNAPFSALVCGVQVRLSNHS